MRESVSHLPIALTSTEQELRLVHLKLLEMIHRISVGSVVVNGFQAYAMVIGEVPGGFLDDNNEFHLPQVDAPLTNDNKQMFIGLAKFAAGIMDSVSHTADDVWNKRIAGMRGLFDIDPALWHEFETQHARLAHRISLFLLQILPSTTLDLLFDRVEGWNASRGLPPLFSTHEGPKLWSKRTAIVSSGSAAAAASAATPAVAPPTQTASTPARGTRGT